MTMSLYSNTDAVCCALAPARDPHLIDMALNTFSPGSDPLPGDYTVNPSDPSRAFTDQQELIHHFSSDPQSEATLFWEPAPDTVGAHFTNDGQLIISVTTKADGNREQLILNRLQSLLNSSISLISYTEFPSFENGVHFIEMANA